MVLKDRHGSPPAGKRKTWHSEAICKDRQRSPLFWGLTLLEIILTVWSWIDSYSLALLYIVYSNHRLLTVRTQKCNLCYGLFIVITIY